MTQKRNKPSRKQVVIQKPAKTSNIDQWVPYFFLGVIIVFFGFIRIRLLSFPLERDEGEYAYFGQLILDGIPPFKLAFNLKLPGTDYMYALSMAIFGQSREGIRLGLMFFNIGSIIFLFFIARRLFGDFIAVASVAVYAVFSVNPSFLAQSAHATHFVTFYMLGGVFFLLKAVDKEKWYHFLLTGLFFGMAFLMKQSGFFFAVFGGLILLLDILFYKRDKLFRGALNMALFIAGVAVPLGVVFLVMKTSGVFERFWFWTFVYPAVYGSKIPLSSLGEMLKLTIPPLFRSFYGIWFLAGLGLPALFLFKGEVRYRIFLGLFVFFSLLPAIPGFYFRQHYFIPFIPAIGLLAGLSLVTVNQMLGKYFRNTSWLSGALLAIFLITGLKTDKNFYFNTDPVSLGGVIYRGNPFVETISVSNYIKANATPRDTILVFGSEPQIYFYTHTRSATGYIYMYDLVFEHPYVEKMQKEMIAQVEKSKPKYIVFVSCPYTWLPRKNYINTLFSWFNNYLTVNKFIPVGIADIYDNQETIYAWDKEALSYARKGQQYIIIFRKQG